MNIYIGFTLFPKSHAKNRLVAVLNYLFLLIYANTTSTANMMMTIMCIGMPNKCYLDVLVVFHLLEYGLPIPQLGHLISFGLYI